MRLVVVSHKVCWKSPNNDNSYQTDGGFPLQMEAISELFDETKLLMPCSNWIKSRGGMMLKGRNLKIKPLSVPKYHGFLRKLGMVQWIIQNGMVIWREVSRADAVHAVIPGDVGTIGLIFALIAKKPLFVRHCGNWFRQKTLAEMLWKRFMERFAGGRNVMFATGETENTPSKKNSNIKWIFSTTLKKRDIAKTAPKTPPRCGKISLITVCRLEEGKGVDVVIHSLPEILQQFPHSTLEIVGDGTLINQLKAYVSKLGLNQRVNFHGAVSQPEVFKLMNKADIFCLMSSSEGFPKVVIEALACGLPVVASKLPTLEHLIEQGGGVLLDKITSQNLSEAIITIGFNPENYRRLSSEAIATASRYSLENWQMIIQNQLRQSWNVSSLASSFKKQL